MPRGNCSSAQWSRRGSIATAPSPETVANQEQRSFNKLWARIEASESISMAANATPSATLRAARTSRTVRWLAAAVIVQSLGLALFGIDALRKPADFHTVADVPTPRSDAPAVRVAFAPDAAIGTINTLLAHQGSASFPVRVRRAISPPSCRSMRSPRVPRRIPWLPQCRRIRMSPSRSQSRVEITRQARRSGFAVALCAAALAVCGVACAAPPVLVPPEVRSAAGQFIVLAVANPIMARPGAVGGTAHGYGNDANYRVSASATAALRAIVSQYSLVLVAEWPIEPLQVQCVVLRIPAGTTREAMIGRLKLDRRVLIVQPLNEFESAASTRLWRKRRPQASTRTPGFNPMSARSM
jgi:hypothetical protein